MFNPKQQIRATLCVAGSAVALAAIPASASAGLPQGAEPVDLDPAEFTTQIDNPYFPLVPGDRYTYRETEGGEKLRVVLAVSDRTRAIANGITARVVHDRVTEGGKVVEDTFDWYAQDSEGNVWYLGEDTVECKRGKIKNHAGAFEAGVDGAQAGIAMPADPKAGQSYRQEYYAGHAEDRAKVLSVDEQTEVPFGHFTDVLMTKDLNPLEPKVSEYKLYARGVGLLMAIGTSGGGGVEELLKVKHDRNIELPAQGKRCKA